VRQLAALALISALVYFGDIQGIEANSRYAEGEFDLIGASDHISSPT